jgi:uncharacterized membrane protein
MLTSLVNCRLEYPDNQISAQSKIAARMAQGENSGYDSMQPGSAVWQRTTQTLSQSFNTLRRTKMANSSSSKKTTGIALIVIGAGLAFWATQKSEGLKSQLSSAVTGSHSDNVMILYIAAAVCVVVGAFLFVRK